jgi:branched-chain amino acid transport system permease protein
MIDLISYVVYGVFLGTIYLVLSIGFTFTFGIARIVNFAYGEFFMIGAYVAYFTYIILRTPFLAFLFASFIAGVIGALIDKYIVSTIRKKSKKDEWISNSMIIFIALSIMFQYIIMAIFGPDYRGIESYLPGIIFIGTIPIGIDRLVILTVCIIAVSLQGIMLKFTRIGKAIRATAQNLEAALASGINIDRIIMLSVAIGTSYAGLAGALLLPLFYAYPTVGLNIMLKVFIIVILGGLGSLRGSIIASYLLGFTESIATVVVPYNFVLIIMFFVLILVLIIRPYGLFGEREL